MTARSHGGRYYQAHREAERERKRMEQARYASAAYAFVRDHPEYADHWQPKFDDVRHAYRLPRREERDWRSFLRLNGWQIPEKGRAERIGKFLPKGRTPRPLTRAEKQARELFHSQALGRSPESYPNIYGL
jgi:hypothetical protein